MNTLHTQVSRADILRLLAVSRTASADLAAKSTGFLPEQKENLAKGKKITRSGIRSNAQARQDRIAALKPLTLAAAEEITRKVPSEAFWHLSTRKRLKKTHHRLTVPQDPQEMVDLEEKDAPLPAILNKIKPLSREELFIPPYTPCIKRSPQPSSPVHPLSSKRQSGKHTPPEPDIENLVAYAAELPGPQYKVHRQNHTQRRAISRNKQAAKKHTLQIQRLLGLLSIASFADPFLLQNIVRLIPSSSPGIATEAALLAHPDAEQDSNMRLRLKPEKKKSYYRIFAQEEARLQTEILDLLRQRDATAAPLLFASELLTALPFLRRDALQQQIISWLEAFILRFTRTWFDRREDDQLAQQAQYLFNLIEALPRQCKKQLTARSFLYGIVHHNTLRAGAFFPPEYDAETIIQTVRETGQPVSYQVRQQGEKLLLYPSAEIAKSHLPGSPLLHLELSVDCLLVQKKRVYNHPAGPTWNFTP